MFGELPKLLGKTFLIGYLLPAALIVLALAAVLDVSALTSVFAAGYKLLGSADEKQLVFRLGLLLAIIWLVGVVLLAINYKLIRILEGYGAANPARLWRGWSSGIFLDLTARHEAIETQRVDGRVPEPLQAEHRLLRRRLGNEFPEAESLVLPTRFGNVVRAFERYPQVIYGIEAINTWPRLQAVIPAGYLTLLDEAKAQLDLWVNLWFGGLLVAAVALAALIWSGTCAAIFAILAALVLAVASAKVAQDAAGQWGALVKGAFDLYRGELCKQLGFEMPRSITVERSMWTAAGQAFLYRRRDYADNFTRYRPLEGREE